MSAPVEGDGRPEFTVVVCSRNGARTLAATLSSLQRQSLPASRYEIIVVDDGSTDGSAELAREFGVRVRRLVRRSGLAAARNAGIRAAEGTIVAFTDDDCEPDAHWLGTLASAFADPRVDAVSGRVVAACTNPLVRRYLEARNPLSPLSARLLVSSHPAYRLALYLRQVLRGQPELAVDEPLYSTVGANMAFRRSLLLELGGFDEAFGFGADEEDLCRRAHARAGGAVLRYEPSAVVVHHFAPELRDSLRRARAYGVGNARSAIKHADQRPIIYPFPILNALVTLAASATGRRRLLTLTLFAPMVQYPRWMAWVWRRRSPEPALYPYLQLAEELWTMVGEVEGWRAGYAVAPIRDSPPDSGPALSWPPCPSQGVPR